MARALLLVVALALIASPVFAQTTQPRITAADVTYLGTITLPSGVGNPNALAVDGSTMYVGCYFGDGKTGIATVTIPALGGTGTIITGCTTLPNLTQVHMNGSYTDCIASGIMPYGGRVIVGCTTYYDGSGGQVRSMWAGTATSHAGPYEVVVTDVGQYTDTVTRYRQPFVGGFQGMIPTEWRALFGGNPALAGGCCFPIIFRTSLGPSASAYNPDNVGVVNPVPTKMIVGYPYEHSTLGRWEDSPPSTYYGGTDQMGSVGFPSGSRSVLFTSRHGQTMCYGPGTSNKALVGTIDPAVSAYPYCYDPYDAPQGNHGPDYEPTMTAYDANDLVRVYTGELKAWEVQPYAKWVLPGLPLTAPYYLRAGWFDEATNRYYVGDTSSNVLRVFNIAVGTNPTPVDCVETAGAWGPGPDALGWTNWVFYTSTQETRTRNRTWTQTIAAVNGGVACTYSATTVGSTGVQTETEYRSTDTTIGMVASGTTVTCTLTTEAFEVPPGVGWVVQFARRLVAAVNLGGTAVWTEHGSPDTTAPYTASATVPLGTYEVRAIWSQIGATDVPAVTTYPTWACVP